MDYKDQIIAAAREQERAELGYNAPKPVETNPYAAERQTLTGDAARSFLEANGYAVAPNGNAIATEPMVSYDLPILNERETTHGDYGKTAETAQGLKRVMYDARRLPTAAMRESIDLICTKMARIANGDASEPDHWRDIAGYASLVAERLERGA
jgi:hypothetical protein